MDVKSARWRGGGEGSEVEDTKWKIDKRDKPFFLSLSLDSQCRLLGDPITSKTWLLEAEIKYPNEMIPSSL